MTNFVQCFKSTDTGAPTLTGQVGSLITLLNKCLVDGYATANVTSITRSGSTATATLASADATLYTGAWVTFANAVQPEYNINAQITVVDPTHVTFAVSGTPATPATTASTLTYNRTGLGWTRPFVAGTNAQTYRSADATSNQFYLQVIDNAATAGLGKEAQVFGAEVMSADQTVTSGRFPTTVQAASGLCVRKSTTADATARAWTLIGDDRTLYFISSTGDTGGQNGHGFSFGHFISFKAGDGFNTFIAGGAAFNVSSTTTAWAAGLPGGAVTSNVYLARSYTQAGTAVVVLQTVLASGFSAITGSIGGSSGSGAALTYPNAVDGGLYVGTVLLTDTPTASLRGRLPGYFAPLHVNPLTQYDESTGVTGLSGVTLVAVNTSSATTQGQSLFDKFGPWN
jgi:hypothetical protein